MCGSTHGNGLTCDWQEEEDAAGFLDLAKAVGVRLLYTSVESFSEQDLDEMREQLTPEMSEQEADEDDEEGLEAEPVLPPEAEKLLNGAQSHIGQITAVWLAWVHGGVLNQFVRQARWHTELEDRVTELQANVRADAEERRQVLAEERAEAANKRAELTQEYAERLAREPDFQNARGGDVGRMRVARRMFPELKGSDPEGNKPSLSSVVQEASAIFLGEIQPAQERKLASDARALLDSHLPKAEVARRLGISPKRLDGLLMRHGE